MKLKNLFLALMMGLAMPALVVAQVNDPKPPKPADLLTNNLLTSPDFGGSPCYAGWQIEVVETGTVCRLGDQYVWLNHNNRAGDPAVKQALTNLTVGADYEIVVGWAGGYHGPMHGVTGARNVFAIDLDGREIKRLTTGPNFTNWMVNDGLFVNGSGMPNYNKIIFKATATSHTLRFRGEVGADGDVVIDWVQVKSACTLNARCKDAVVTLNSTGTASIAASAIDNGSQTCGGSVRVSPENFDCTNIGSNQVILTATDSKGNTSSCTATVAVKCTTEPVLSISATTTVLYLVEPGRVVDAQGTDVRGITLTGLAKGQCPAYNLEWNTGEKTASISVKAPTTTTTYTLTASAKGGNCPASKEFKICVFDVTDGSGKIKVAHQTSSATNSCNDISISLNALKAHLATGGWLGTCGMGKNPACN